MASTIGWKLPLLIMAWSGTETSGLSSAAFSSDVTAFRAAATYSRRAPWTCGTTRNDSASCTDRGPPGCSSALPSSRLRRWSAAAAWPGIGLARATAGCRIDGLAAGRLHRERGRDISRVGNLLGPGDDERRLAD